MTVTTRKLHGSRARCFAALTVWVLLGMSLPAAASDAEAAVPVRPELAAQLATASPDTRLVVLVSGDTTDTAVAAVKAVGLTTVEVFEQLSIVAASGVPDAVHRVHAEPGVRRVDANVELTFHDDMAHRSTGVAQLRDTATYPQLRSERRRDKTPYDGTGVSIAVVDSGFDTAHEQFVKDGDTKFDAHLRQACANSREGVHYVGGIDPGVDCSTWIPAPPADDASSGHGTIVAGVAAGYPKAPAIGPVSGTAPGARLVGLATGGTDYIYNALSALNWVLEHHANPCGDWSCPPIRVVNNSYGLPADDPAGLGQRRFDPGAPMSVVTTKLIEAGVVVVFAAGNEAGDGSDNRTNVFALHPQPGMLGVGAYYDRNAGDRDASVWLVSSRGRRGDPSTYPDLVAPGANYLAGCSTVSLLCVAPLGSASSYDGAPYGRFSGTSLSAPYIAGVVAQMLEARPTLTPGQVEDILEDSAYQGFIATDLRESDVYHDADGNLRGNADHLTSFHAGHGLVDVVGALSSLAKGKARTAPAPCPGGEPEATVTDPVGDTPLFFAVPSPLERPGFDIVEARASLLQHPGALTVAVRLADLPATDPRMHLTVAGNIDDTYFEVDLDRSVAGEDFTVFSGEVQLRGSIDASRDIVTFVVSPLNGAVPERAGMDWAWTSTGALVADADFTYGTCQILAPPA